MRIKHAEFGKYNGWQYWIDTYFAILPNIINTGQAMPQFVWLCRYWKTYPVDADGKVIEMYRVTYSSDPRKK